MTTENQLLPCPFCGTAPKKIHVRLDERYSYAERVTYECPSCGCTQDSTGDHSKGGYADNSKVQTQAIQSWNRRAQTGAKP